MRHRALLAPLAALAVLLLFNALFTPGFFHITILNGRLSGSLIDILNRGAPVMLLAIGMTLVIASGGVDLSVGAVMAIAGAAAACLIARPADSPLSSLPVGTDLGSVAGVSLLIALLCGAFNGFLVGVLGLQPIVATLLLMVAGRGVAQLLTNGQIVTFHSESFHQIGGGALLGFPVPVWLAIALLLVVGLFTRRTAFGLFLEATGSNRTAASLSGVRTRAVLWTIYAVCALCAGIAGLAATSDIQGADANNAGLYKELDAILAVAIGGTSLAGGRFSLVGSLIGALLMQALDTTLLARGVPFEVTLVLKAIVVIALCVVRSPAFAKGGAS